MTSTGVSGGFDFAGAFMRRKWLVVLFAIVGGGLGYLYFLQQVPVYESSTQVLVSRGPVDEAMNSMMLDQGQADLMTDAVLIKKRAILDDAINTDGLDQLSSFRGSDPAYLLSAGLSVSPVSFARGQFLNILELRFRCGNPDDAGKAVAAVADAYRRFLDKSQEDTADDVVSIITRARNSLMTELETKEAAYIAFRENSPLLWQGDDVLNVHQERMLAIEGKIAGYLVTRGELLARLEAIEQALKRGVDRETLAHTLQVSPGIEGARDTAEQPTEQPDTEQSIASQMFPLILQERELAKTLGPGHPRLKRIRERIEFTRKFLTRERANTADRAPDTTVPASEPSDWLATYVKSLQEQVRFIDREHESMQVLFERENAEAKKLTDYEIQNENHRRGIDRTERLLNGLITRLEQLNVANEQSIGARTAEVIQPAGRGYLVAPNLLRIMMLSVILGAFAGVILGAAVELTDKSFRDPAEISHELGLPLLGHIPVIETKNARNQHLDSDPILCCLHRPRSRQAEAFRGVRNALLFSASEQNRRIIQVTSPTAGDGKSTVAANLAIAIAKSGKSTILVDLDFRRPQVHRLTRTSCKTGAVNVIRGEASVDEVIQSFEQENLTIMCRGPRPGDPAELLLSPVFAEMIHQLRERYDFVILDSPPVLAVSDAGAIAALADGVLITLQLSRHTRKLATSAISTLYRAGMGSELIGAVINRIDPEAGYAPGRYGAGTYGNSGLGYGYGYGYGQDAYYNEKNEIEVEIAGTTSASNSGSDSSSDPTQKPR